MLRCDDGALCEELLCSRCARRYRVWFAGQCLRFAVDRVEAHIVTIQLVAVRGDLLHTVNVRAEHERLRKRLIRCGVRSAIGGTEADYDAPNDRWVVHVHLLVFGEIESAIARLKVMARGDGLERPVKCQRVRDRLSQVTYLQKFVTYHRPGKTGAGGKGLPYPLKPRHVAELARWFGHRRFGDFAFLLGFRRRGSRIVAEPSFADIVAEGQVATRRAQARERALDLGDEVLSPRGCSEPSCRAFRVRATPESAECPCRPRADGLRRNDAANEARPPCAAPPPSPPP